MSETTTDTPPFERISVTLPPQLLVQVDAAAAADRRTRSNFIVTALECLFRDSQTSETHNTSEQ